MPLDASMLAFLQHGSKNARVLGNLLLRGWLYTPIRVYADNIYDIANI